MRRPGGGAAGGEERDGEEKGVRGVQRFHPEGARIIQFSAVL